MTRRRHYTPDTLASYAAGICLAGFFAGVLVTKLVWLHQDNERLEHQLERDTRMVEELCSEDLLDCKLED